MKIIGYFFKTEIEYLRAYEWLALMVTCNWARISL